jgi:hypothetical protein
LTRVIAGNCIRRLYVPEDPVDAGDSGEVHSARSVVPRFFRLSGAEAVRIHDT